MIECKICKQAFKSMISWKHLKKHQITTAEYKKIHGNNSLVTKEYRLLKSKQCSGINNPNYGKNHTTETKEKISVAIRGNTAWNKDIPMTEEAKKNLSNKNKGNPAWNKGLHHSDETKAKIREKRKHQIITPEQIQKALQTKRDNGYDLAIFRGKKHSEESKQKISKAAIKNNKKKTLAANQRIQENAQNQNLTLLSALNTTSAVVKVQCDICENIFKITKQYLRGKKLKTNLCNTCHPRDIQYSQHENEISEWLEFLDITVIRNSRQIIAPYELDIFLPDYNLAIEYNGLYWHSEIYKDKKYHLMKSEQCYDKGIHLISLFEDEYINNPDIVKSRIQNHLFLNEVIYARNCTGKEISAKEANTFLNQNHIQGSGRSNNRYGLYYNHELIAVMTFSKSNISRKLDAWELNRFCTKKYINVVGGANKLFKMFLTDAKPESVISYADRRWSSNAAFYEKLDFSFDSYTPPSYWYIRHNEIHRYHRYQLRKNKTDIQQLTEWENRKQQGWNRIWDCGNIKYIWKRED